MSWYMSVTVPANLFEEAIRTVQPVGDAAPSPEQLEQMAVARDTALAIFRSGAAGREGMFTASLGGHANPGHLPQSGWVGDGVNVTVSRVDG